MLWLKRKLTQILSLYAKGMSNRDIMVNTKLPLKTYEDLKAFKLFLLDTGLLTRMTGLNQKKILNVSDSTARRFLNKLVKGGILEAIGERKGRKYRKK